MLNVGLDFLEDIILLVEFALDCHTNGLDFSLPSYIIYLVLETLLSNEEDFFWIFRVMDEK